MELSFVYAMPIGLLETFIGFKGIFDFLAERILHWGSCSLAIRQRPHFGVEVRVDSAEAYLKHGKFSNLFLRLGNIVILFFLCLIVIPF